VKASAQSTAGYTIAANITRGIVRDQLSSVAATTTDFGWPW
jgi:hypothetical protein